MVGDTRTADSRGSMLPADFSGTLYGTLTLVPDRNGSTSLQGSETEPDACGGRGRARRTPWADPHKATEQSSPGLPGSPGHCLPYVHDPCQAPHSASVKQEAFLNSLGCNHGVVENTEHQHD